MKLTFWRHLAAGLMACSLAAGCGSEQEQLQDEKQDVQEAREDLQEEKQDVQQEQQDDPAAGHTEPGSDIPPEPSGNGGPTFDPGSSPENDQSDSGSLQPTPDDPDSPAVREENADSLPAKEQSDEG